MKIFTLLHKSTEKGTINIGRKSRITPFLPLLVTLVMLTLGGWNSVAWGSNADFYSKGRAYADPTGVGKVYVWVDDNHGVSEQDGGWTGQGTSEAYQLAKENADKDSSPTHFYTFMADHDNNSTDTLVGYTFRGWYEDAGHTRLMCATREISPHPSITTSAKSEGDAPCLTFYAWWTANNYTVTLNNHGATTAGTTSVGVTYDATTGISSNIIVPTKTDYTFDGYYTGENGTGTLRINASGVWQAASGFIEDGKWKNAGNVTLHAKWIANSKTITLDNQGADDGKGGTASIEVFYNRSTNLTEQAVSTLPIKSGYTFEGYFTGTNGSGTKIFDKDGFTVENAKDENYTYTDSDVNWKYDGDITLYAYWKQNQSITWNQTISNPVRSNVIELSASASSSLTVTYTATSNAGTVSVDGNTITCLTAGSVTVTAHQTGNSSWNAAADASKTFTIIEHAITTNPTASGTLTYEQTLNTISPTGGVTNVAGSWAWKYPTSVPVVGTANQVAVFTPSSSIISACPLECNVSVTVNKANPDVTCTVNANTHYVDDTKIDLQSTWTREGDGTVTYTLLSYVESGENNDDGTDPYIESNRYLHLGKAGTAQLKMAIAAGTNYIARNETIEVVINKHDPAFAWNTQTNYYYNTTVNNFLTKTSGASYTVTSSNEEVANMDGANLKIYNKAGTTKIKYVHPQTYKWNEKKDSVTFTPEWKSNHVTLDVTESNYTSVIENHDAGGSDRFRWTNGGVLLGGNNVVTEAEGWDSRYIDIHFSGMPDSLSFTYERSVSTATGMDWWVKEKTENGEWSDETIWTASNASGSCKKALKPDTRWVRLRCYCNYGAYFKNIKITKKEYFKTDSTSFDFQTQIKNANVPSKSFKFKHANAGYTVTATSNDSHYKVSLNNSDFYSSIIIPNTGGDRMDSSVVYVKYYPSIAGDVEETHNATITFSDALSNSATVSLTGKTQAKLATFLEYIGSDSYSVNADNIAATSLFQVVDPNGAVVASPVITLSSSNTSAINTVSENRAIDFLCGAEDVRITASYAGDDDYAAASDLYHDIDVIKLSDAIVWSNVAEDGKIHVWAESDIPSSIASANEAIDAYTSSNSANVRVSGSKGSFALRARRPGEITLTAHSEGSCTYSTAEDTKTIMVVSCAQDIIWEQNLAGLSTEEDGTISRRITLNAYAVDSNNVETGRVITYSLPANTSFASIENGNELVLTGTGSVVLTASTASDDTIYAQAQASKLVRVRVYGAGCGSEIVDKDQHAVGAYDNNKGKQYGDVTPLPPIDKIYVRVGKYSDIATQTLYIYGYNASGTETTLASYGVGSLTTSGADKELSDISEDICRIKIKAGGTISKWYSDLRITQKSYLRKSVENISNDHLFVYENVNETIRVSYSDKPLLQYRYTGSNLTLTPTETVNNDCGGYGYYDFVLSGSYSRMGDYHDTIYITTTALDTLRVPVYHRVSTGGLLLFNEADGNWNESGKWSNDMLPRRENDVTISKNVIVTGEVEVYSVTIVEGGSVTINPGAGLTVGAGGIVGSTTSNLILKAGTEGATKGQTGYLRISPEYASTMPNATVELYSTAYHNKNAESGSKSFYQCIGAPISDAGVMAKTVFGAGSYLYTWNESTEDWTNSRTSLEFTPFKGFEVTQKKNSAGLLYTHAGHIVSGHDVKTIDLDYTSAEKGYNLLANSWTAPIDISQFESYDFVDATSTIYILNAGTKNNSDNPGESVDAPGKWIGVPIKTAAELAADGLPRVIPSMQGFWVKANSGSAQLKLDYSRLVWGVNYSGYTANKPLRVQQRDMEEEDESRVEKMKINIYGAEESDVLFMLESNKYDKAYEDGYDAYKISSEGLDLYSIEEDAKLSVDATYSISGTALGLRTGDETAYTFRFTRVTADKWALWDIETGQKIDINEGTEYTFFTEPDSEINGRFMIIEREEGNNTTTQIENTNKNTKGSKFIKNDCLYILKDGKLYDTLGRRVR